LEVSNKNVRFIVEVSIFAAIGVVLDFIAGLYSSGIWTAGGSLSIAMVPIFMMSFRWNWKGGILTGLLVGTIQLLMANSSYFVNPVQVILDYTLAYGLVGISGIYAKKVMNSENSTYYITIGIIIGGLLRTISHIISGWAYFGLYAPEGFNAMGWSIIYNSSYMLPSLILCLVVVLHIRKKAPQLIEPML
jgi:thiamine transporter